MVQRIKLKASHIEKAKKLRIYGKLMKEIESYIREEYPGYMNSKAFLNAYNKHILVLNNKSWSIMICHAFRWNESISFPEKTPKELLQYWLNISEIKW